MQPCPPIVFQQKLMRYRDLILQKAQISGSVIKAEIGYPNV